MGRPVLTGARDGSTISDARTEVLGAPCGIGESAWEAVCESAGVDDLAFGVMPVM